ncbi:hypothetical protein DICVIV_11447 [Dictyocaulus viviparus]|uniref:Uncharacterized protein n=1 Tax=Dictyocaulus viviparus TaxID=29172 RepID=A0A0D8XJP1_DICVI|nr:hypothetical protein DICVIV_11447 [Dictyocaulus viviparus]
MECLIRTPWALIMLAGGQLSSLVNCSLAIERMVALQFFVGIEVYELITVDDTVEAMAIIVGPGRGNELPSESSIALFVIIAVIHNIYDTIMNENRACSIIETTGIVYGTKPSPNQIRRQRIIDQMNINDFYRSICSTERIVKCVMFRSRSKKTVEKKKANDDENRHNSIPTFHSSFNHSTVHQYGNELMGELNARTVSTTMMTIRSG